MLPIGGATVNVEIEGAETPLKLQAGTDGRGRVAMTFPMPKLGAEGGQLVIRASGGVGQDEVRYRLKPRVRKAVEEVAEETTLDAAQGRK